MWFYFFVAFDCYARCQSQLATTAVSVNEILFSVLTQCFLFSGMVNKLRNSFIFLTGSRTKTKLNRQFNLFLLLLNRKYYLNWNDGVDKRQRGWINSVWFVWRFCQQVQCEGSPAKKGGCGRGRKIQPKRDVRLVYEMWCDIGANMMWWTWGLHDCVSCLSCLKLS